MRERRLYRSRQDRRLFGICGGIAEFLRIDSTLVRVGVVVLTICTGVPILIYLLLAMIMPKEPSWTQAYTSDKYNLEHEFAYDGYRGEPDLDSQIDRMEKRALVLEVQRLREELLKYKGI